MNHPPESVPLHAIIIMMNHSISDTESTETGHLPPKETGNGDIDNGNTKGTMSMSTQDTEERKETGHVTDTTDGREGITDTMLINTHQDTTRTGEREKTATDTEIEEMNIQVGRNTMILDHHHQKWLTMVTITEK